MIHLYTGNGKGKTTAAIGLCIRALGWNMQVCFAQFMKGNDTGELHILKNLPGVSILRSEKNLICMGLLYRIRPSIVNDYLYPQTLFSTDSTTVPKYIYFNFPPSREETENQVHDGAESGAGAT